MGEKDLVQKSLEFFPDVFADCVNALLYKGEQILHEEELLPAPTETTYLPMAESPFSTGTDDGQSFGQEAEGHG